jgi:multicomponent K+:H+ antiporter subunit F
MLTHLVGAAFVVVAVCLLMNLWRLIRGPSLSDRILALDTMYVNTIALIVLLGVWQRSDVWFEAALIIALIGFVGTAAVSKYMLRGDIIE